MNGRKNKVLRILFALGLGCLAALLFGCGRKATLGRGILFLQGGIFRTEVSETEDLRTESNKSTVTEENRRTKTEEQTEPEESFPETGLKRTESDGSQTGKSKILTASERSMASEQTEDSSRITEEDSKTERVESETPSVTILVHICGAVMNGGVYAIPEDGRVADAVEAAGGFTPDAAPDYINMAQRLYDGSKVIIPTLEEVAEEPYGQSVFISGTEKSEKTAGSGVTGASASTGAYESGSSNGVSGAGGTGTEDLKVNINTADVQELTRLPGIGQARAEAIVNYRRREGEFTCAEDLTKVPGIGESIFRNLREYVSL